MIGNPFGRLTRVYNAEERAVIDAFKPQYMEASSAASRKQIAHMHIFPALFNHWASIGQVIDTEEEVQLRSDRLLCWLRNVWRSKKKNSLLNERSRYRLSDVLWWTRQSDVFKEIASIMNINSADTHTVGWFQYRTTASKNLIDKMTNAERNMLRLEADHMVAEGLPEEVQRKVAEEKWYSRFSKAARKAYNEMGLVSISVVVYIRKNGQLAVDIHDDVAEILGVPAHRFNDLHSEKANEMMRAVRAYVNTVREAKYSGIGANARSGPSAESGTITIQLDPNGFPIAPSPASWDKISKKQLEKLYRTYMTEHYRLASRAPVKKRQVPFRRIAEKQSNFIHHQYLPRKVKLDDPRGMKREDIINFFEHIRARQESGEIKNAFRFKSILSSRKKGKLCDSQYIEVNNLAPDEAPSHNSDPTHDLVPTAARAPADIASAVAQSSAPRPPAQISDIASAVAQSSAPRPIPRPKYRGHGAKEKNRVDNLEHTIPSQFSFNTFQTHVPDSPTNPFLTVDPAFVVDQTVVLDPSLDPTLDGRPCPDSMMEELLGFNQASLSIGLDPATYRMPIRTQLPSSAVGYLYSPALTPEPDIRRHHQPSPSGEDMLTPIKHSNRKTAEQLAMEEAKDLLSKRKRRR